MKTDTEILKRKLKMHAEKIKQVKDRREPKPGELATISLEEEFGDPKYL